MSADTWSLIARAAVMIGAVVIGAVVIGAVVIGLPVRGHNPHIMVWS
jgi:hypothetical protein